MRDVLELAYSRIPAGIAHDPRLQDIAACMPEQSRQIVRTAFACRPEARQRTYEQLKQFYADTSAQYLQLSHEHYAAMMLLIDWMLPETPVQGGEEE